MKNIKINIINKCFKHIKSRNLKCLDNKINKVE
jgi:hypothetical protein